MNTTLVCKNPYEHWENLEVFPIVQEEIEAGCLTRILEGLPDKKALAISGLKDALFTDKLNENVYKLCCKYIKQHGFESLNTHSLILSLEDKEVYFAKYIKALGDCYTCSADMKNYVIMLQVAYKRRREACCKSSKDFQKLDTEMEQIRIKDSSLTLLGSAANYLLDYDDKAKSLIKTGYPSIDHYLGGLLGGNLMLIAASTSMGKTAFILNMICKMAMQNIKILFFSLEMTTDELLSRIVALNTGIDAERLRNRNLTDKELDTFAQYVDSKEFAELQKNITMNSEYDVTIDHFAAAVRKSKAQIVVVDYLGLIKGGTGSNRYEKVSEISRSLKILANETNKPFVVLHQLNRDLKARTDKRPVLSDIRDSGSIEQDFDIVSFLYRPSYFDPKQDKRLFEVIFAKSRHTGAAGKTAHLIFDGAHQRITDPQGETQEEIKQCSMKY